MTESTSEGVWVEGRTVPFPKSISDQARANLARLVDAEGRPIGPARAYPPASDIAAWAALKEASNTAIVEALGPAWSGFKSSCETTRIAGVVTHVATPAGAFDPSRAYLDIHGGALIFGGGGLSLMGARRQADLLGVQCYGVDYRTPPEDPYPAPLDDCVAVYRALLERYAPEKLIIGGGSAGGNLAAATVLRARDEGLPLPAAVVLLTPELDLTESGDTFETNRTVDLVLRNPLMAINLLYAAGHDLRHPYLSPLFGDFAKGFPPTFLQAGTRDLFLSNTVRMHRALRKAGVPVEIHVFEGMPHGGFSGAPEDLEVAAEMARFAAEHWKT
jgi:acetyl esterase/lipase